MPMTTFDPVTGECRVLFRLQAEAGARQAWLAGDFNEWSTDALPLEPQPDGSLAVEIVLEPGRYRFRYYLGDGRWDNDWDADAYENNDFGGADSVLVVPPTPGRPDPAPDVPAARPRLDSGGNGAAKRPTSPKGGRRKAPDRDRVADV